MPPVGYIRSSKLLSKTTRRVGKSKDAKIIPSEDYWIVPASQIMMKDIRREDDLIDKVIADCLFH